MKIPEKIAWFFKKKKKITEYSRRKWWVMNIQLFIYAMGVAFTGNKIGELEYYIRLGMGETDFFYVYVMCLHGVFLGLAAFRLFEVYWYAKDVNEGLNSVTSEG